MSEKCHEKISKGWKFTQENKIKYALKICINNHELFTIAYTEINTKLGNYLNFFC